MRVKKRFLSAVLLTAMVCASLSGCGDKVASIETDNVSVNVVTDTADSNTVQYNTVAPPEDGWTDELINSVLYVDGKPFSMQSNINDLEGFVWNTEYEDEFNSPYGGEKIKSSYMTYGDYNLSVIVDMEGNLLEISSGSDMDDFKFVNITVNGITVGSNYSDVISKIGSTPDDMMSESMVKYVFSESQDKVCFRFFLADSENGDKVVDSICVYNSICYND